MNADWLGLVRRAGFRLTGDNAVIIKLPGGGEQQIFLESTRSTDALYAWSIIAPKSVVTQVAGEVEPLHYAWERNRLSELIGFSIDKRGRLIGETWIPYQGSEPEEVALYFHELARVADWHEFRLSGEDRY